MQTIETALEKLQRSPFRRQFHLGEKERAIAAEKGLAVIRQHAQQLIAVRLAPAIIENDGKQTPMRGHPVFIAQHATACCCRGCLNKWYKVPMGRALTETQQQRIVNLLMAWIEREMQNAS